jgi:hypothetical protein
MYHDGPPSFRYVRSSPIRHRWRFVLVGRFGNLHSQLALSPKPAQPSRTPPIAGIFFPVLKLSLFGLFRRLINNTGKSARRP